MRNVIILAAASVALTAAMAMPALATQYCGTAQVQGASNNGDDADRAGQHIWQGQGGALGFFFGTFQKQDANNKKDDSTGGNQKIGQKQFGIVLFGHGCPVQDQDADNYTGDHADWDNQTIHQSQKAFIGYADGSAQKQDADNRVTGYGDGNDQSIEQSQSILAGSTDGTQQSQSATNSVDDGDQNDQSIHQSQHLVMLGGSPN
jgi:hypothetical protein